MRTALVAIAVLAGTLATPVTWAQSPTTEVVFENASIRVTLLTFVPGGGTGPHQGLEAEIGIVLEGELIVESPMGRQALRPGAVYWLPGLTPHDVRNESPQPAKMWNLLLRRCD